MGENRPFAKTDKDYNVVPHDPMQFKAALSIAPIAAVLNADSRLFRFHDGINAINNPTCGITPNHQVLGVGYGSQYDENGRVFNYMLIKNSHGNDWGNKGYGKISMS